MYKWAMTATIVVACFIGIFYTVESIIDANEAQEDLIVEDNELRFLAYDFNFGDEEYVVEAGKPMNITMRNEQGRHAVFIQGPDLNIELGDTVEHTFDTPGVYDVFCSLMCGPGHAEMVTQLTVVEAATAE